MRDKEAKDELKRLEVKEQIEWRALQEEWRGERSKKKKIEVEMRKWKG